MASVPFSSTKETTNYARLCRLLVDVGSQVLRETFDKIHLPSRLHRVLADPLVHNILQSLWKKRIINPMQWSKLYPADKTPVSSNFDVTLLMVLLRNICNLLIPATGWDSLPPEKDTSLEADIARIKFYRNTVYAHANKASVDDATFSHYWQDIRDTLLRLGGASVYEEAIDSLANDSMDPEIEQHYQELLRDWKKEEDSIKDRLDEIDKKLNDLGNPEKRTRLTERFDLEECQKQLRTLYSTMSKVKIIPWDRNSAVHIDEIYTQLSWHREDAKPSGVTKEKLEDYTDIFKGHAHHPNPKRILVCGRPGIGKTTFSKKTAFDWSQQRKGILKKFDLVLQVKLRDVCDLHEVPAIFTAAKLLAGDSVISTDGLYKYILQNQEKVLLILDGYDEYSCEGGQSPVHGIWEGTLLRDCHVIITTRLANADSLRLSSHVQYQIDGFDSNGVKKFVSRFLKDKQDVDKFVQQLKERGLTDMAEIPLLLLMLCLLWREKYHRRLPKSRAMLYTHFIQTLLDHRTEKEADVEFLRKVDDYKEELSKLGKLAFDALLHHRHFLHVRGLPDEILMKTLVEAGLFQILQISSLDPKKGVYFLHKSIQEFLAGFHLKEEVLSRKVETITCLSKVDSFEKIFENAEVLTFACELSEETACTVLSHLVMVGNKENLTEYNFSETPSIEDLSSEQRHFLTLCSRSFFCCSSAKRIDLFPMFLSYVGGVLFIDSDQLHSVANDHLLKSSPTPHYIFFSDSKHPEQDYNDLITVLKDLDGLLVTCSGKMKASNFLKRYHPRSVEHFFLKKEENMYLYFARIYKRFDYSFPNEMLKDLTSLPRDQSNKQGNTTALCLTQNLTNTSSGPRHCLFPVWEINIESLQGQEMQTLIEVLSFVASPRSIMISVQVGEIPDAQLLESLVSSINFTNKLDALGLWRMSLTAKPAAIIAKSLYQAPNLRDLYLSYNPLGEGVSVLAQQLSCVPRLKNLRLGGVKMTRTQVDDLAAAVRCHGNLSSLGSYYHDEEGNPTPENEWRRDEDWERHWWYRSDDKLDARSSPESKDELDPGTSTESKDELEPRKLTQSENEPETGASTEPKDELEPGTSTQSMDELEPGTSTESKDELKPRSSTESKDELDGAWDIN